MKLRATLLNPHRAAGAPGNDGSRLRSGRRVDDQRGGSVIEILIAMGILMGLMAMVFQSFADLSESTARDSTQSYATSKARGAMEIAVVVLRNQLVQFNTLPATAPGVNFDLDDVGGVPVVRDGLLFYYDANGTAMIFNASETGQPVSAGLDDADGDGMADVIGFGLVAQDVNNDEIQDFIDLDRDGNPDDVDLDGNPDPLWTLTMVQLNNIGEATDPDLWRAGRILATNAYIRRVNPNGPMTAANILTFQFSSHNPLAMLYDAAAEGGDEDGEASEVELGNMVTVDGIINDVDEVAGIDSITITLNVAEVAYQGLGRSIVLSGDISSDLITPRILSLIRRNGIMGLPDPTLAANLN